ncbi:methionine adenosyltransferase 2 subunit beta-like [Heracleum sosnowskyi]|uniref:Methionine adenosyltransferase 2 subunit beta-like n=1 Tax=Heracleum sosnowskyi TaxID=360622 RepID=A0AAD8JFR9_9APIA|nr:methionine adenosyltransferase 2 subunit beta-like [Heracleum sosnowskyi]
MVTCLLYILTGVWTQFKAYITRVGYGPFPTEILGKGGDLLRFSGHEFGTTTGHPRRCGWLDVVALKYCCQINVYDGVKSFYKEEDETAPVNVYGRSKLESEHFLSANWANFAILRSSIIYGPQTAAPVRKSLPVQWLDSLLAKGREVEFCHDEFRCPIFIKDVVTIIQTLTSRWVSGLALCILHVLTAVFTYLCTINHFVTYALSRKSTLGGGIVTSAPKIQDGFKKILQINRGVKSPADISMDISKLIQMQGFSPMKFEEGVRLMLRMKVSDSYSHGYSAPGHDSSLDRSYALVHVEQKRIEEKLQKEKERRENDGANAGEVKNVGDSNSGSKSKIYPAS